LSSLSAQVTIGADNAPQSFSVLELISGNDKGLRLPQLTQLQRDTLDGTTASVGGSASMIASASTFAAEKTGKAMGLTIFNTTTLCVETWNGTTWIKECAASVPPFAPVASAQTLCSGATVADLVATAEPGHTLKWYNVATGGSPLASGTALADGNYYVSQTNSSGLESPRTPVVITITMTICPLAASAYNIFSPVSVMYTYQYQDLTLYKGVTTGGDADSFKWYVKKKGVAGDGTVIPSATSSTYRVPSNYRNSNDTLIFTCEYTNPASTPQKISTEIEFIKLNEANKIQINGADYYWVELDVPTSNTAPSYSNAAGKLKVLATNLGVETANAADLGDFYQWGRVADGHQTIGWSYEETGTTTKIRTVAFDAVTTATAIDKTTATYGENTDFPGSFLQIVKSDALAGKFIITPNPNSTWQATPSDADQYIWTTSAYSKTANDPCPSGWHVPSTYEWGALVTGVYTSARTYKVGDTYNSSTSGSQTDVTVYNTLRHPSADYGSAAHIGGIVISQGTTAATNASRLFLPAAGFRFGDTVGAPSDDIGVAGYYWSTIYNTIGVATCLGFRSGHIVNGINSKSNGLCVRCVAE
jgi:uncharacterized protein (TIGR02145 family)